MMKQLQMRDQYGVKLPKDLVVLSFAGFALGGISEQELNTLIEARWYESESAPGVVLASFEEIGGLSEIAPKDCGVDPLKPVNRIAESLKRWSIEDGFYHA